MYGGCLCFLKVNYPGNSWLRIAAAFVINIIISGFVEFLSLSLHFLVSRERYDFANRYIVPGYVYVLQLLMSVFALTACIRLFAKKTFVTNRIVICQFCLCAVQALICFYLCYCFYMERVVADVEVDIFICCTLLVHLIRGRILPVLFVLLQPCGVFWGLQVMLMQHFSLDYGRYLPYMLSGVLPMQWANEPYLQLFLIVGVSLLLAYIGNVLVLKKKDL